MCAAICETPPTATICRREERNRLRVEVNFRPLVSTTEDLSREVADLSNPQIVTWFMKQGLKKEWLTFCRDNLLKPCRESTSPAFVFYNLCNWGNLRNTKVDKTTAKGSKIIKRLDRLNCRDIRCLDSALFFQYLKRCNTPAVVEYTNSVIWKREFIWKKSERMPSSGISLERSLGRAVMLDSVKERDVSKAYSALQYMEGIFLVIEMIRQCPQDEEIDLVFLLPNDEVSYYVDGSASFQKDVEEMLLRSGVGNKKITITFLPFQWGKNIKERPYLCKSTSVKGEGLALLDTLKA